MKVILLFLSVCLPICAQALDVTSLKVGDKIIVTSDTIVKDLRSLEATADETVVETSKRLLNKIFASPTNGVGAYDDVAIKKDTVLQVSNAAVLFLMPGAPSVVGYNLVVKSEEGEELFLMTSRRIFSRSDTDMAKELLDTQMEELKKFPNIRKL